MGKTRVLIELWKYLGQQKKYWLIPMLVTLGLLGLLLVFAQSSPVAPFIYTLF